MTNAELIPDLVTKARQVEMGYFQKLGVYDYATRAEQEQSLGKIIGIRWVDSKEPE